MRLRRVDTAGLVTGSLWLAAMPGRFETWAEFTAQGRLARLALVLCLTPRAEIALASPEYHRAIVEGTLPFRWLIAPMRNYGLPEDMAAFHDAVGHVVAALRADESVLLHCAAGIGRTGTAAACVLKQLGLSNEPALERVRQAGSNPENALQSGLADRF